jgi:non-ribosomal peptide synthetase component F
MAHRSARPAVQSFRGAVIRLDLPSSSATLRAFSRREEASLFMTMFTGFLALLQRYTGQEDVCVGSGLANRRLRQTEGLGMIMNTVALRVNLSGDPMLCDLLRQVRQTTLEAYAHQDRLSIKLWKRSSRIGA